MIDRKLTALHQLLSGYLHQDWPEEFDTDVSALRAAVESEPKEMVLEAVEDIDAVLGASLSEDDLRKLVVRTLGCYFEPAAEGITYDQWLRRVRNIFTEA